MAINEREIKLATSKAFTLNGESLLNVLKTKISLINAKGQIIAKDIVAIWDTGATGCAISEKLAKELNLISTGFTNVNTADGTRQSQVYGLSLLLPLGVATPIVQVTDAKLSNEIDFLIGMNVIVNGDFSITNVQGKTTFSFRIPSLDRIDYVDKAKVAQSKIAIEQPKKKGPCPCGSGKQFKDCCARYKKIVK